MRSYIKIFGPPISKAVRALEKIAVDMPHVSIMNRFIMEGISPSTARDIGLTAVSDYFRSSNITVTMKRRKNIISKSGEALGEYDFFFEWLKKPTMSQLHELIEKIDEALAPLGCLYTITTQK